MSMTLTDAKTAIARVIGGQNDANVLALAGEAVLAKATSLQNMWNWEYLRKDNSQTRTLTGTISGTPFKTVTLTSTAGINVGQSVTVTDFASVVTTTTVASITNTTVLVLTDGATASGAASFVFAAYIPVIAGTDTYYLPHDFVDFYGARLITAKRPLEVTRLRHHNRTVYDQSAQTFAGAIMPAPGGTGSGFTAADQRARCRIVGVPEASDSLHLDYYRAIDGAASTLDMPDGLLYPFLDLCKAWLLRHKNASDPRADFLEGLANREMKAAMAMDGAFDDEDVRMVSSYEAWRPYSATPYYPID